MERTIRKAPNRSCRAIQQYIKDLIRSFPTTSIYKYLLMPGTNWETLLCKEVCHSGVASPTICPAMQISNYYHNLFL